MASKKNIKILGFTPLAVILAESLTYRNGKTDENCFESLTIVEQLSANTIDDQWQSVHLLCLINLLKQCRILQSEISKSLGFNIGPIDVNYAWLKLYIQEATGTVQRFYLKLLKKRGVRFEDTSPSQSIVVEPWKRYFCSLTTKNVEEILYSTYEHLEFDQTVRSNAFNALFNELIGVNPLKFIGSDSFAFELAQLVSYLYPGNVYLYRMRSDQALISISDIIKNRKLNRIFESFSQSSHEPIIRQNVKRQPTVHFVEEFSNFLLSDGRVSQSVESAIDSMSNKTKQKRWNDMKTIRLYQNIQSVHS